ncbi:amino acid permease/ SLC12A domain-containing protein [Phakopsora pachyrhizi]|uniref:Amino acid permease/ SLC12A domain-containing protein n=1 Tax=Phakopsora pachyrhizi TaxID=170000 RepID=A0AAV0AG48_PHAPC|nr:amino acid permease/ SLC12A domain-containing protein [Phakopsora pachyrhizi]CAH7666656.1 amino acid permease/ SLC12A domain-containing protein [Phakopsora pachyrhizi]
MKETTETHNQTEEDCEVKIPNCREKVEVYQSQESNDISPKATESNDNLEKGQSHKEGLNRSLESRHIQMISIGGVIVGTGLFLGTAISLSQGGPLGLFLGYLIFGSVIWNVMCSLGEMVSHLPVEGGHVTLAGRFVNPSLSFAVGWNYWYTWAIILPAELSASAILINYWTKAVNNAVWITLFLIVISLINIGGARAYAEFEFWFASIKVVAIVGLIILGLVIDAGGGPNHDHIGFRYWRNPGPFTQYLGIKGPFGRFLGFWTVLIQTAYAYNGCEITAITAGEAKNPRKSLPSAIRGVALRIGIFYLLGTFVIGLLVASDDPRLKLNSHDAASSPFVIAIQNANIKFLPSIINAALLTSTWSAGSSNVYISSRTLYSLARSGNAPKFFRKTTSWGLPWPAVIVSISFGVLGYLSLQNGAGVVFGWFASMNGVCGLITWITILITYIRFDAGVRHQKIDRAQFPYRSRFRTIGAYYALSMCALTLIFNAYGVFIAGNWQTGSFFTGYFPIFLFITYYIANVYYRKRKGLRFKHLKVEEMVNFKLAL